MVNTKSLDDEKRQRLIDDLDESMERLASARDFAKPAKLGRVLDTARRLMLVEGGLNAILDRAHTLEEAGVFAGTDWDQPQILVPALTCYSLKSADKDVVVVEALSELRLLAVAQGKWTHSDISAEQAHHYLTQVLAINLAMLFTPLSEAERETQGRLAKVPRALLHYLADSIGYEHILDKLIAEIWRILQQRPIQTDSVKQMITQIAICRSSPDFASNQTNLNTETLMKSADELVSALFGPSPLCSEDPGVEAYKQRIDTLDNNALISEAQYFANSMHRTGLVSPYHPVLVQSICEHSKEQAIELLTHAMGLSSTGKDSLLCYHDLVIELINKGVSPSTPQALLGLTSVLERGILYQPAVAPSLWRQLKLKLSAWTVERLTTVFGNTVSANARLLEGVLLVLGLPLGIGQGNNPTCQSARALSIWSHIDPDFLLHIIANAASENEIIMHFEGQTISSKDVFTHYSRAFPIDLDPVSILLVPHLDFIYGEMGKLCIDRPGDPHRWINPEFHGWHVNRGFQINVDVATGQLIDLDSFLGNFYAYYHPFYNGNQPLIHPQPAGIAITDSAARFIGWHAITIQRVALDPSNNMRVYFYNPNNDSGQDWGDDVIVSTADHGEYKGESSLLFEQFASRIYIFHDELQSNESSVEIPQDAIDRIKDYIFRSWGKDRNAGVALQA